jgi:CRISPR/Cas system CSM-associated protein Csm3 (group 7 of RAMP superfamily)
MNITYQIEFFTEWHCGSGLAAGADVDALVVKDCDGFPYIPGKTLKGLIKEGVEEVFNFEEDSLNGKDKVELRKNMNDAFGYFDDKDEKGKGCLFFSNAELPDDIKSVIKCEKEQEYLYRSVSSTSIDDRGIAKEHSLRRMETTVPCTLEGVIINVPSEMVKHIERGMQFIKRLGVNRNRGLGRCAFINIQTEEEKK